MIISVNAKLEAYQTVRKMNTNKYRYILIY